jgi:hypothetical protein
MYPRAIFVESEAVRRRVHTIRKTSVCCAARRDTRTFAFSCLYNKAEAEREQDAFQCLVSGS